MSPGETVAIASDARSHFVSSGWFVHSRHLLKGDYMPPFGSAVDARDTVTALSAGAISSIPVREVLESATNCADTQSWLDHANLRREAMLAEKVVSLGQRSAYERTAHNVCELIFRQMGPVSSACDWPLTQTDLADALGLSVVHMNRMLQSLRKNGFVELGRGRMQTPDFNATAQMCGFDPGYLQ